jgi:hypothetical protein
VICVAGESSQKDDLLTRYLLDETSRAENEDLQDDMELDENLADRLQTLEMFWTDCYLANQLSPEDRTRFEQGFLKFPENQAKLEDARILHQAIDALITERESKSATPQRDTWWPPALRWPSIRVPAFAALALLVIGLIALLIFENQPPKRSDKLVKAPTNMWTPTPMPNDTTVPSPGYPVPHGSDHPTNSPPPPVPPPLGPTLAADNTLIESNQATGEPMGPGSREPVKTIKALKTSPFVPIKMQLKFTKVADSEQTIPVTILTEKFEAVPGFKANVRPFRISKPGDVPKYVLPISVPTRLLKDNETYYFTIPNASQADGRSITPFKVSRTKN